MSMPIIQRRRIEAELIKEVYDTLVVRYGTAEAAEVITESVRRSAVAQARQFAESEGRPTSLETFAELYHLWTAEDALTIDVKRRDAEVFDFNVTRCRYAEMYREMGLAGIGHLLSCNRDGAFCQGYDPSIRFSRTQTLMQGASHCDFRYRYESDPARETAQSSNEPASPVKQDET
jgi:hypothetical protein